MNIEEQIGYSVWNTYRSMANLLIGEAGAGFRERRRERREARREKQDPVGVDDGGRVVQKQHGGHGGGKESTTVMGFPRVSVARGPKRPETELTSDGREVQHSGRAASNLQKRLEAAKKSGALKAYRKKRALRRNK